MTKKCNKYEFLFVSGDEKALMEHLAVCKDCANEHLEMQKISNIVKEVKPYFKKKKEKNLLLVKMTASVFLIFSAYFSINIIDLNNNPTQTAYFKDVSVIEEMGFPVDEYGLLVIE
ncbi:MAG: hypothetical protein PHV68_05185 [Candidatus Gastranaerophilales bacterium]|nr:hypothetical protein [Candidatus Gastranaerophilales bacterium]